MKQITQGIVLLTATAMLMGCQTLNQSNPWAAKSSSATAQQQAQKSVPPRRPAFCHGLYSVQQGETLASIAQMCLMTEQDIIQANALSSKQLKVGQTLSLPFVAVTVPKEKEVLNTAPPSVAAAPVKKAPAKPVGAAAIAEPVTQTLANGAVVSSLGAAALARPDLDSPVTYSPEPELASVQARALDMSEADQLAVAPVNEAVSESQMLWPMDSKYAYLLVKDDKERNGIEIYGEKGAMIRAAQGGEVAFAGDGIREYGLMVMLKHQDDTLTVYAHTDSLLVKEGDKVRKGDFIAKMGDSGLTHRPKLYLEVRKEGRKIDAVPLFEPLP